MLEMKGDSGGCSIYSGGAFCMSNGAVTFDGIKSAIVRWWCLCHRCMTDWKEIIGVHVKEGKEEL